MFQRLFRNDRETNRSITEALYSEIVAAARQPVFYADWGVPDTPLGRYEMISLHMLLALRRMRSDGPALREISQAVTDHFFLEVDHSLRELGVGDPSVPKRMKRLARMHYGRAQAYSEALAAGDRNALAAALLRNVWPTASNDANPTALADYVMRSATALDATTLSDLQAGRIAFSSAVAVDAAE